MMRGEPLTIDDFCQPEPAWECTPPTLDQWTEAIDAARSGLVSAAWERRRQAAYASEYNRLVNIYNAVERPWR